MTEGSKTFLIPTGDIQTRAKLAEQVTRRLENPSWKKISIFPECIKPVVVKVLESLPSQQLQGLLDVKGISILLSDGSGGQFNGTNLIIYINKDNLVNLVVENGDADEITSLIEKIRIELLEIEKAGLSFSGTLREFLAKTKKKEISQLSQNEVLYKGFDQYLLGDIGIFFEQVFSTLAKEYSGEELLDYLEIRVAIDHELRHKIFSDIHEQVSEEEVFESYSYLLHEANKNIKLTVLDSAEDIQRRTWGVVIQRMESLLTLDYKVTPSDLRKLLHQMIFMTLEEYLNNLLDLKIKKGFDFDPLNFIDIYSRQLYFIGLTPELNALFSTVTEDNLYEVVDVLLEKYNKKYADQLIIELHAYMKEKSMEKVCPKFFGALSDIKGTIAFSLSQSST